MRLLKEYVFGFKLAAAIENNFKNSFSSASNQILELNKKLHEHNNIAQACASAVKQGSLSVKDYNNALGKLSVSYSKMSNSAKKYLQIQGKINQRRTSMGQNESNIISLGSMAYGLVKPLKSAIEFESAMSDVRKVVEFETPQQFQDMNKDILNLSKNIPMSAKGLAAIVAAGGQSGIAREELLQFAESAAKMGTAFDITADQAGEMMAKWRTAFKMNQNDVVTLADKINFLSNNTAASAPLISDVVTRIGPLGAVGGVASGEIAALGASLVGSGIQSEVAATGIKNLILTMVSGASATKGQKEAFQELGFSAEKMAMRMQKDAKGSIIDVLKALKNLDEAKQGAILQKLFGKESIGAIAPLLSNLEGLEKNIRLVADANRYNGSMQDEFATKAQTTANQLTLMKNECVALETEIGNGMLPVFKSILQSITPVAKNISSLISRNSELVGTALVCAAGLTTMGVAFNGVAWVCNGLSLAYLGLKSALVSSYVWMVKHEVAAKLSTAATKAWTVAQWAWNTAKTAGNAILTTGTIGFIIAATKMGAYVAATKIMTAMQWAWNAALLANPIGLVVGGLVVLAGIITYCYNNIDSLRLSWTLAWIEFQNSYPKVASVFEGIWKVISAPYRLVCAFVDKVKELIGIGPTAAEKLSKNTAISNNPNDYPHNALGGIYSKGAFLTTFAENSGESAIPHTPNARNIGLLAKTNEIMGNPLGGNNISVNFSPVINASGGADTVAIQNAIADERRRLETMLKDLMNQQRRLSYA